MSNEIRGLIVAGLLFILVLTVSYIIIHLHTCNDTLHTISKDNTKLNSKTSDTFVGGSYYSPACGSKWVGRRSSECKGITTGKMPLIDVSEKVGRLNCGCSYI